MQIPRAILLFSKHIPGGVVNSSQIAEFLSTQLGNCPIISMMVARGNTRHPDLEDPPDVGDLYVINSSTSFTFDWYRDYSKEVVTRARRVIYVQNDFKLPYPSKWKLGPGRDGERLTLTTVVRVLRRHRGQVVNWNKLAFNRRPMPTERNGRLLYYGSIRQDRLPAFEEYFGGDVPFPCTVSASSGKSGARFRGIVGENVEVVPKLEHLLDELGKYSATFVLEDPYGQKNNCSPPNRFYEALSAGTAMIFDSASGYQMSANRYAISPYVVIAKKREKINELLARGDEIADEQREKWGGRDYRQELIDEFKEATRRLNL